ncbi:MAG: hypothetical protein QOE03_3527, partial [Micromonosporaceae bacterium]|nr:hypothetical protein [Micromonosporaceae bacterium]
MVSGLPPSNIRPGLPEGLDEVTTREDLARHLSQLMRETAGLSLGGVVGRANELRKASPRLVTLARSTVSDWCNGKTVPEPEALRTFLLACQVPEAELGAWRAARDRVAEPGPRPDGSVRVRDADPRMLGVRRSIQLRGGEDELPAYVPRDVETDLLAALAAVKGRGGMVLVVGDSAVGKTRTLAEAVQTVLSDWWLLHPTGGVADVDALAASPAPRTVLWLDELQRYLEGLQAGTVRRLFAAGVVVVATLWPGEYGDRVALPGRDGPDLHADAREILHLARVVDVPGVFSDAELARARQAADGDPLLRTALSSTDAGMTQALAAGPELLTHWKNAPPAAKAVITAALDARRLGARAPLRREFLAEAAPPYLDRRQRGKLTNGDGWLDSALEYATTELHGATACLNPSAVTIGQLDGYTSADILYQQVLDLR